MYNKKHYQTKRILFVLVMLFCFLIGGYKLFFYLDHRSEISEQIKNKDITRLSKKELSLIKEGDFILRRGFGFFSDYVSTNLNDGPLIDVTHAGIITKQNDTLFVIHSLSSDVSEIDGVQKQPLSDFLQYSAPHKIIITRLGHLKGLQTDTDRHSNDFYVYVDEAYKMMGMMKDNEGDGNGKEM